MHGVICYSDNGAGLNDRKYVFLHLLRYAHALNATVQLGRPCDLLTASHNNGINVSCSYAWNRYIEISPPDLLSKGAACTFNVRDFYKIAPLISVNGSTAVSVKFSSYVQAQAASVASEMRLPKRYDGLHIRRTDAQVQCDTRLSRMRRKLQARNFSTPHVLFCTDERDPQYLRGIERILKRRGIHTIAMEQTLQRRFPNDKRHDRIDAQHAPGKQFALLGADFIKLERAKRAAIVA